MLGLVVLTGGIGFLTSYALLHAGLRAMALRYPIATLFAYAVFLGLIRLWVRKYRVTAKATSKQSRYDFDLDAIAPSPTASGGSGSSVGGGWDFDLDGDGVWLIPIAIIAAIVFCVVAYLTYLAPTLFAEVLLDAGLAAGLYRRLIREERNAWLRTAMRSTVIPACFVAALLALAGTIMQDVYPDAVSIGVVVHHLKEPKPVKSDQ